MNGDAQEKQLVELLQLVAGLSLQAVTLESKLRVICDKISESTWESYFQQSPTWCDYYFLSPVQLWLQVQRHPAIKEEMALDPAIGDPLQQCIAFFADTPAVYREVNTAIRELEGKVGHVELRKDVPEEWAVLEGLVMVKALLSNIRAHLFYGQPLFEFIAVGQRGNDEGYFRAVTIDPAIQWHTAITERISRDALVGKTEFAERLQRAAHKGPSKNIDVDLHQLRFVLGLFRIFGLLAKLSHTKRYEFFCMRLGLYPDNGSEDGRDVKRALNLFINRWERSLLS